MSSTSNFSFTNTQQNSLVSQPLVTTPINANLPSMSYSQLEEMINKLTRELDDLESCFFEEASKMNDRDCQLINNGDKIASLHDKIEQCSLDQSRLEQELQLFEDQQDELEAITDNIEKDLQLSPVSNVRYQHPDRERENIYQLAENCQNELDNILNDVKQMVDKINRQNQKSDSDKNEFSISGNDMMNQVTRILNAHMQSLNWINQKTNDLMAKLDNMQLS